MVKPFPRALAGLFLALALTPLGGLSAHAHGDHHSGGDHGTPADTDRGGPHRDADAHRAPAPKAPDQDGPPKAAPTSTTGSRVQGSTGSAPSAPAAGAPVATVPVVTAPVVTAPVVAASAPVAANPFGLLPSLPGGAAVLQSAAVDRPAPGPASGAGGAAPNLVGAVQGGLDALVAGGAGAGSGIADAAAYVTLPGAPLLAPEAIPVARAGASSAFAQASLVSWWVLLLSTALAALSMLRLRAHRA
ncbi:MAG: hypothetical protein ACYDAY_10520 [Candidatus Dormibacteria bacterium]